MSVKRNREKGQVIETLPNLLFKVKLEESEEEILAYLKGRLRRYRIKVLSGDKVLVERSSYDSNRGIIVYRLKK